MSAPWLYVTVHEPSGFALVRGNAAGEVTKLLAPDTRRRARDGSRGWVIPASLVGDLEAYANRHHCFVAITRRGAA